MKAYQPIIIADDGIHVSYDLPAELLSNQVFKTKEAAEQWLKNRCYNMRYTTIFSVDTNTINEPITINENGEIVI